MPIDLNKIFLEKVVAKLEEQNAPNTTVNQYI